MQYADVLQAVDPMRALKALELAAIPQGAYIYFPCTECGKQAAIKAYGEKKNLIYCKHCKTSGHIIKLVMKLQAMDWETAKKYLKEKAMVTMQRLTKSLGFDYELQYVNVLESKGLSRDFCQEHGIGKPKGQTMLAGCIAFTIYNEEGTRIAYYGIRMKDQKPVFHHSFNPELYLYQYHNVEREREVFFTTDIWKCLEIISKGSQAVCNFGLPYLSPTQIDLLQKCSVVIYHRDQNFKEIMKQVQQMRNSMKFID